MQDLVLHCLQHLENSYAIQSIDVEKVYKGLKSLLNRFMKKELNARIVVNPGIMVGKPIIKGTRIPVDTIIRLLAQGMTQEEILEDYPNLKKEDIKAALEYGANLVESEDVFPLIEKGQ